MSKVAILGDTHFGVRNGSRIFSDYFDRFYSNVFFPYLKENNITHIIQLGDLFDHRKYTNLQGLSEAKKDFFNKLEENEIELITLIGNHDIFHKNTLEINSPSLLLKEYKNVKIISNPTTINLFGVDLDIIPWICQDNETECLDLIKSSKSEFCFGHFEIAGFGMIRGVVSHEGMDETLFKKYETVMCGHYHHKSTRGNIHYTGTPYELTWNDYNDQKGFYVLDLSNRGLEYVNNPYRIFNKIFYDDIREEEQIKQQIFEGRLNELYNTYVKVVVKSKENFVLFDSYLDYLSKVNPVDLAIIEESQEVLSEEVDEVDESEDTITILNKFVDNLKQKDLDQTRVKNILNGLYNEAMSLEI